jgi:cytidine deaminase
MELEKLATTAVKARDFSYSPYSSFKVGAALLTSSGTIYTGCNIENAAYSPTLCAERTAIAKGVSEGETSFTAIAIAGWSDTPGFAFPCGVCRQTMMEFCNPESFIVAVTDGNAIKRYTLAELLPNGFGPNSL